MSANDYYNKGPQQPQYGQPQQGGYYPPPGQPQGYPQQQQYPQYPQQQPVYVQQPPAKKSGGGGTGCLACLAGACLCVSKIKMSHRPGPSGKGSTSTTYGGVRHPIYESHIFDFVRGISNHFML
ncbi:hypothetical protein PGT21_028911 [Puccinia graminis f. sp. tritici]|uniref:Cysteine-rich transmembrane CYSTM domain-containing protein n=1 Tax=Puccinia graminis f. sp. tritici TaxID=56615 RepID=A0A5B0MZ03_PUCGR|nr:hypothetical protein PGT21_028911 [Puccinia graminis f. sp. tritici]